MPNRSLFLQPLLLSLAWLACERAAHAQAPHYTAQFAFSMVPGGYVDAINASGVAVGWVAQGDGSALAWVGGVGQAQGLLPLPAGCEASVAYDINADGVICGVCSSALSSDLPALWIPNGSGGYTFSPLQLPAGAYAGGAAAINDLGDVVGWSALGGDTRITLFSAPGGPLDLGSGFARALNNQRVLVFEGGGSFSPKRLDLNTLVVEDLGLPAGTPWTYDNFRPYDINDLGQVVGGASVLNGGSCKSKALRFSNGIGWEPLGSNCGLIDRAYCVNNLGDVVMQQQNVIPSLQSLSVHVQGAGLYPLSGQIDAGVWTLSAYGGAAINDVGDVAVIANQIQQGVSKTGLFVLHRVDGCQTNLGYGGPGHAYLSLCGGDLSSGTQAQLKLIGAAPLQPALLVVGTASQPRPLFGGTVVPLQSGVLFAGFQSDAAGSVVTPPIVGGGGPQTLYAQFGYLAPQLPQSIGLSNALRVEFLP